MINKKKLIIIGAGNVGGYLAYNISDFPEFEIIGFLDDDVSKHGKEYYGYKVLNDIDHIQEFILYEPIYIALCIHSPKIKRNILERVKNLNVLFPNFISPRAWVSHGVKIGAGVILYPGVSINYECELGDFIIMNMNCAIGHNVKIESFCSLAPGVNLGGFTYIEEGVDFGIGACTKQNIKVGSFSIVGGQCMLIKNVSPSMIVAGVPGKSLR